MWLAALGISAIAIHRMIYALPHAVRKVEHWSAVNVAYRHDELTRFFAGTPIYHENFGRLTYPPATYVFLWPVLGWLPLESARVLFRNGQRRPGKISSSDADARILTQQGDGDTPGTCPDVEDV